MVAGRDQAGRRGERGGGRAGERGGGKARERWGGRAVSSMLSSSMLDSVNDGVGEGGELLLLRCCKEEETD